MRPGPPGACFTSFCAIMNGVMHMKKAWIVTAAVILTLVLVLTGVFFWKGGHHAIALYEILEEYADTDDAVQSLTVQLMQPGITVDEKEHVMPDVRYMTVTADSFWTEHADRKLFGLTVQGVSAYTDGKNLYMDTGNAYSLPQPSGTDQLTRDLALGMLLYGRITKSGDDYRIRMEADALELDITVTADRSLRAVSILVLTAEDTSVRISMTAKEPLPHPIPQAVADAIVRAGLEPPMALTEPLEAVLPALENLLPLEGALKLGVECGILELQETVSLRMDLQQAQLERKGTIISIELPEELSGADPALLGLLLLRSGTFTREDASARFDITLPAETTDALCASLVPQIADLGITFSDSHARLTITDGRLVSVTMTAQGEVPFLVTTIPVAFLAELTIP